MPTTVRRASGVPARRATNTTSGASPSTSDATFRDASASTSAFLTTPRSWSGDASKSDDEPTSTEKRRCLPSGSLSSDESAGSRSAKSGSRRTAGLQHSSQEMRDHARVEGVEQGLFPLALRLVEAHVERRAHHEALELSLHDPVRAAGTGQAQVVAMLPVHPSHSCFISSRARPTRSREEDTTNSVN